MTKVKFELECLKKLLKRDSIVKIVNELPDKETADLNYIYIIPKEGEGKDKKAYVLRPDRSGFDTIDLTPQLVNVVGEGYITVEKETLNENGDVTFTVTTSSSLQAVLDSLSAKDSEQDTRLAVHDTDISNLKAKDAEVDTALGTLGTAVGKVTELVENKAQGLDTRVKALEAKEDSDKQTLAVNGNKLSISNGNEVDLPQYDDTELNDALDDLEDKLDDVRDELEESKENIKQVNDYTEQVKNYLEGKVNANKDAIDANKVDADAKHNALATRVNVLEEAKPVVENKLTEIEAKNTAQDEKITALKEKTKSFLTGAGVTRQGNVVTLTYTNIDGSSTNLEFNDNDTKAIAYDDTALKARVQELENRESNGTIYNDTPIKERLNALENKVDKDTVYDDTPLKERITALETKGDNDTHYNVKSTTDGLTVVKSQENGEEVFTINADLAFNKYYTKGEVDKVIADNNKRTQKLVKYNATWKSPDSFRYTNDGRVPVLSHNNITSFGSMKLDGVILKPMSANTIICEFPPNTPKPIEFIEVQAYIGNEPISMWYADRTVRVTDVPQSLVGKRVIFNFVGLFA